MTEEDSDFIPNTIQPPAIDCTEIIDEAVERTAEKQQQQMNQLTDMISTLTSLISFYSQQQQVPNSSANNTPHSGVGAIANAFDNTPLNGVAPGNQMTGLIHSGVGILPHGENTLVKVAPGSREAGHDRGVKGDRLIPPHGEKTPKELHLIGMEEHAKIHLKMVLGHQIQMIVLSLSRRQMYFLLLMMADALSN